MKLKNSEDANQLQNAIDRLSHIPEIKTRLTVFLYQESNCEEMEGLQNQIKALLRTKASHNQAGHARQAGHTSQPGVCLQAGQTQAGYTRARAGQVQAGHTQVQAGHARQAGQVQAGHHAQENVHLTALQELNRRQTEKNWFLEMIMKRKENSETNNDDQETDSEISESNSDIESAVHFRNQNPDFNSGLSSLDLIQEFDGDFETNNDLEKFGSDEFPYQQSQLFEVERQNPHFRALNSDFRDEFPDLIQESDDNSETNDDCLTFGLGSYAEDDINDDEFLYHQSQMFEIERRKT